MRRLKGKIQNIDEYEYVSNVLKVMHKENPETAAAKMKTLDEEQQKYIRRFSCTKRIKVMHNGKEVDAIRKLVKGKSKMDANAC